MPDQTTLPPNMPGLAALDNQPVTQFGDFQFPCASHDLDGEQRDHIHEWPHRDAGAPEKLGRKLYTLEIRGLFHANMAQFPDLYPYIIDQMQLMYEQGTTAQLVHPSVGSFPAYIKRWKRRRDPKVRSGETVDITFQEDQQSQFLQADIANAQHHAELDSSAEELNNQLQVLLSAKQATLALDTPTLSLFGAIQTLANDITGTIDTANMYGNLVSAKAQQLAMLCSQVDGALGLQDARAYPVVDALHDVWFNALSIQQDVQSKRAKLVDYMVPTTMPLTSISTRLYGDATHTDDLLSLNANVIPDPLRVEGGTTLYYYPTS